MVKVPDAPDVKTKKYYEFRGVDFTHDHANVFYRRSPDAVNLMPDEAGRPIKRHGWNTAINQETFLDVYNTATGSSYTGEIKIITCKYFTLAGNDFIVIFTNKAVFLYSNELSVLSTDTDCINSYDRNFFFEANGKAAFYIYGGLKVWQYYYSNGEFAFEIASPTVPTVIIAASADGAGTTNEAYNMLTDKIIVQYLHNTYSEGVYKVKLINEVDPDNANQIVAVGSVDTKFDTPLTLVTDTEATLQANEFRLKNESGSSYIEFGAAFGTTASTEDNIRIQHTSITVYHHNYSDTYTVTATLNNTRI